MYSRSLGVVRKCLLTSSSVVTTNPNGGNYCTGSKCCLAANRLSMEFYPALYICTSQPTDPLSKKLFMHTERISGDYTRKPVTSLSIEINPGMVCCPFLVPVSNVSRPSRARSHMCNPSTIIVRIGLPGMRKFSLKTVRMDVVPGRCRRMAQELT